MDAEQSGGAMLGINLIAESFNPDICVITKFLAGSISQHLDDSQFRKRARAFHYCVQSRSLLLLCVRRVVSVHVFKIANGSVDIWRQLAKSTKAQKGPRGNLAKWKSDWDSISAAYNSS